MDLSAYRDSPREQARVADLMRLVPQSGERALDIGARDGFLSRLLAGRFDRVVALDLERPVIDHPRVESVKGDASKLAFDDDSFDVVLCAEVLEHIPPALLPIVCSEITRVTAKTAVIGVPYRQDLRYGRTSCRSCGGANPPWGHVNSFDEDSLCRHFSAMFVAEITFVGTTKDATNVVSAALMDYAGNPFGTYAQEEGCVICGSPLQAPTERTVLQRAATRAAHLINRAQGKVTRKRGNWLHIRFDKHRPAGTLAHIAKR